MKMQKALIAAPFRIVVRVFVQGNLNNEMLHRGISYKSSV
jgi:hypothetical protein